MVNLSLKIVYGKRIIFPDKLWSVRIRKGFEITQYPSNRHLLRLTLQEKVIIEKDVWIKGMSDVAIGARTLVGRRTVIGCTDHIQIGSDVLIADNVSIRDTDHAFDDIHTPIRRQGIRHAPIVIEDDVWIGYGAVVTKGVRIGEKAVVGANSVVTKNIPRNAVAAGIPAKVIRFKGAESYGAEKVVPPENNQFEV